VGPGLDHVGNKRSNSGYNKHAHRIFGLERLLRAIHEGEDNEPNSRATLSQNM